MGHGGQHLWDRPYWQFCCPVLNWQMRGLANLGSGIVRRWGMLGHLQALSLSSSSSLLAKGQLRSPNPNVGTLGAGWDADDLVLLEPEVCLERTLDISCTQQWLSWAFCNSWAAPEPARFTLKRQQQVAVVDAGIIKPSIQKCGKHTFIMSILQGHEIHTQLGISRQAKS